jgi:hypothetical protein
MVLSNFQFFLGLARLGSCQIGLNRVCKPQIHFEHLGRLRESPSVVRLKHAIAT